MPATLLKQSESISVIYFRCTAGPGDKPFLESHEGHSVSYVRKGSFGCSTRGETFELVTGSVMVGHPGDEYMCTHDHHVCGDECISFHFQRAFVESLGTRTEAWRSGAVAPLPELVALGELASSAAEGGSDIGVDEIGLVFAARFVEVVSGQARKPAKGTLRDRRRAVETARWIDDNSH
jgi:AraC family transcriptional regulator